MKHSFLIFQLGALYFAIEKSRVERVLPSNTVVFSTDCNYFSGCVEYDNTKIPILDTRRRIGMQPIDKNKNCEVIIATTQNILVQRVGFLVDHVKGELEVKDNQLMPTEHLPETAGFDIKGIIDNGNMYTLILDIFYRLNFQKIKEKIEAA